MIVVPQRTPPSAEDTEALVREARARQRRRRIGIFATVAIAVGLAFATYAIASPSGAARIAGGPLPPAAAAACAGPVTPVGHTHAVNNTRRLDGVGFLGGIVVGDGWGATKTVFQPSWQGDLPRVVLRGWRCSDGRPLRFWFSNAQLPFSGRGSVEQLASTGSLGLRLHLARLREHHWFTVGYVLFSSPGKWVVEAQAGGQVVAAALLDFPS